MSFPPSSLPLRAKHESRLKLIQAIQLAGKKIHIASPLCHLVSLLIPDNSLLDISINQFPFPMRQCNVVRRLCSRLLWESLTIISLHVFSQVNPPKIYLEHKFKGMIAILPTEEIHSIYHWNMLSAPPLAFSIHIYLKMHKYINNQIHKIMGRWER